MNQKQIKSNQNKSSCSVEIKNLNREVSSNEIRGQNRKSCRIICISAIIPSNDSIRRSSSTDRNVRFIRWYSHLLSVNPRLHSNKHFLQIVFRHRINRVLNLRKISSTGLIDSDQNRRFRHRRCKLRHEHTNHNRCTSLKETARTRHFRRILKSTDFDSEMKRKEIKTRR